MSFTDTINPCIDPPLGQHDIPRENRVFDHVMCFGTFDILHPWHRYYLSSASWLAREMTIVIARDSRVLSGKWRVPIHDEMTRLWHVSWAFPCARVILWDQDDIFAPIRQHRPDVLAFGYDQRVPEARIRALFPALSIERIDGYEIDRWKSSLLRDTYHLED